MPISKSAKKSLRVSRTKASQNRKTEVALSKALKKVDEKTVNSAISTIDKAAKRGVIHPNKAARLKSKLAKELGTPKEAKSEKPAAKSTAAKKTTEKKPVAKKSTKKTAAK